MNISPNKKDSKNYNFYTRKNSIDGWQILKRKPI